MDNTLVMSTSLIEGGGGVNSFPEAASDITDVLKSYKETEISAATVGPRCTTFDLQIY